MTRTATLWLLTLPLWFACGGRPVSVNAVKMSVYADIICACKDAPCRSATLNGYKTWIGSDPSAGSGNVKAKDHVRFMRCAEGKAKVAKPGPKNPKPGPKTPKPKTKPGPGPKIPDPGPKIPKQPPVDRAKLLAKMRALTTEICACTTVDCARNAYRAMTQWATTNRDALDTLKGDSEARKLQAQYATCYNKLDP